MSLILLCVLFWSFLYGVELMMQVLPLVKLITSLTYPFMVSISPLWLLYALSFARQHTFQFTRRAVLLWIVPVMVVGLVWTNDFHQLYYTSVSLEPNALGMVGLYEHGPGMLLNVGYAYLLLLLGAGVLLSSALRSPVLNRQIGILLAAVLVPLASNVLYFTIQPFDGLDLTPFAFAVSSWLLMVGASRMGIMDVMPVAYDQLFASLTDGVVVLDEKRQIIDLNPAACAFFQIDESAVGQGVGQVFSAYQAILAVLDRQEKMAQEIRVVGEQSPRWLEITLKRLQNLHQEKGWLITFSDISQRKEAEISSLADAHYIQLLNELTETSLRASDLLTMLQTVADRMAELIDADGCYITLWDEERRLTLPTAAYGLFGESYRQIQFEPGEHTLTQSLIEAGKTLVVEDASCSPYLSPHISARFPARSILGIPMGTPEKWLGAIIISYNAPHVFTEPEIKRCEQGTLQVSLAIRKMQLLEEASLQAAQLSTLNQIGMILTSGLETEIVIRSLFEQCQKVVEMDTFFLALYDEKNDQISFPLYFDYGEYRSLESRSFHEYPGLVGYIIKTRQALLVPDSIAQADMLPYRVIRTGGPSTRSILGVPLVLNDRILGVICVQSLKANVYSSDDLRLLETMATQAAVALENARLYADLKRQSTVDELTGLYNYRSLLELGLREVSRSRRFFRPLSALFLDIDHFRDFNNRYSHATGNLVLAAVALCLRSHLRSVDLPFRYGGEEFVVLLPETTLETALQVAERLREQVERLSVPTHWGDLQVTISLGAAQLSEEMEDLQSLLDCANQAEQRAKKLGRNRTEHVQQQG